MTLTNHNGAFKKCAISSKSVAISMLFILPGALGVFQECTIQQGASDQFKQT